MDKKNKWNIVDFESMDWYDSIIRIIKFPSKDKRLVLDIEYVLEREKGPNGRLILPRLTPCTLTFYDVLNLEVELRFQDTTDLEVIAIVRKPQKFLVKQSAKHFEFEIRTVQGYIIFHSTGFVQEITKPQSLNKPEIIHHLNN